MRPCVGAVSKRAPRKVSIPKGPGRGNREISVFNVWDQVVHRAILQIVQPLIDPRFRPFSLGGRPRKSILLALLEMERRVIRHGLTWVVDDDLRNAFDCVPLGGYVTFSELTFATGKSPV